MGPLNPFMYILIKNINYALVILINSLKLVTKYIKVQKFSAGVNSSWSI